MGRERVFPARSAWTRARRSGLLLVRPQERLLRPRPRSGGGDSPAGVVRVDGERRAPVRPPPQPVGSGRQRRLLAHMLFLFQSPDGSGDVDGPDPASAGGRGGRARPFSVPSWVSVVGCDFVSPLPTSLNPGQEVGTGSGRPGCPIEDGLGPGRGPWSGPARLVGGASLTVVPSCFLMLIEAKSPFGDSNGPVPLPVRAKRERAPPASSLSLGGCPCPHFGHRVPPPPAPLPLVDQMTPPLPATRAPGLVFMG